MLKFHENINIIFCGCKPSQKNKIEPDENFTRPHEKGVDILDEVQDTISKGRKLNKL